MIRVLRESNDYAKPLTKTELFNAYKNNSVLYYYPDGVYGCDKPLKVKIGGNLKTSYPYIPLIALDNNYDDPYTFTIMDYNNLSYDYIVNTECMEDTVKKSNGKWTNRGDNGEEHGEFTTKKQADAQRKAMFANGYKG